MSAPRGRATVAAWRAGCYVSACRRSRPGWRIRYLRLRIPRSEPRRGRLIAGTPRGRRRSGPVRGCGIPPRYPQAVAPGGRHPAGRAAPFPPVSLLAPRLAPGGPLPFAAARAPVAPIGHARRCRCGRAGGAELHLVASIEGDLVVPRGGGSRPFPSPNTARAKRRRRPGGGGVGPLFAPPWGAGSLRPPKGTLGARGHFQCPVAPREKMIGLSP
jgi:hypothetical protein